MRSRLDNILLGLLWLLATTLGASFWFNTKYGFNIFSAQHWQYLAYLQASKSPVMPSFYISLGVCVFVTIFGLYFLIQPKFRKITLQQSINSSVAQQNVATNAVVQHEQSDASEIVPMATTPQPTPAPAQTAPQSQTSDPVTRPTPPRPPHLTLPVTNSYTSPSITIQNNTPVTTNTNDATNQALREIFERNGYVVKKNPYINGYQLNLLAIGTNEVLWIGGVGVTTDRIKNAIDKLNQVFSDTLDDITIGINGFSINAPDAQTTEFNDVLLFNTIEDLGTYMATHKKPAPATDEQENFDAYSEYIDTVIEYIGKL